MIASLQRARAIVGQPRSGKTTRLLALVDEARRDSAQASVVYAQAPQALCELAFDILRGAGFDAREVDDIDAAALLQDVARPLLELEWPELLDASVDPEVGGLRSPERFLSNAYRLFRKLREAAIEPDDFLSQSLTGAANFYGHPPNLTNHEVVAATKQDHRDSLEATPEELKRQYRREIDLAKILSKLFACYISASTQRRWLTSRDAVAHAVSLLREDAAAMQRQPARLFFIDDAQELSGAEVQMLRLLAGEEFHGVTVAGDASSAVSASAATAGAKLLQTITERVELHERYGVPAAACNASLFISRSKSPPVAVAEPSAFYTRFRNEVEEAAGIADAVCRWLEQGTAPHEIAVIFRSVCDVGAYERALLDRDVPAAVAGDVNIFNDSRALDALALLWNAWDPFAHAWMLRTLQGPAFALSDATIAALCSEPADPQASLFPLDTERPPTVRPGGWDPKRDLRLGWNVVRGDLDASLGPDALVRVRAFRAMRSRWLESLARDPLDVTIAAIWQDALPRDGAPGSARERAQRLLLGRLLRRLMAYVGAREYPTLGDVLQYAADRRESEFESCEDDANAGVNIVSVSAAQGRSFERVALPDLRAGSFPRWYAPDAFLFSRKFGMIPKENAGDAAAARTAKYTFYLYRARAREQFNDAERQALAYALTRSRGTVLVSASGGASRGFTAPEFLEELRQARVPGVAPWN